jgi:hypothetical protein
MSLFVLAGASTSTGVALANPNSTPVDVTLILRDSNATELARTSVRLNAMGHLARYTGELFPGIVLGEFEGKIDVLATQILVGLTLRQRELAFTSLPVIP